MNSLVETLARIGRKLIDLVRPLVESEPRPAYVPVVVPRPRRLRRR